MENLLRLLNPKTTNFEGVSGGSYGALTAADVCVAMSYAKLSMIENALFTLYAFGPCPLNQVTELSESIFKSIEKNDSSKTDVDHKKCIFIALVEICNVSADYKPSVTNRALIGGVNRMQIHRKMGIVIDGYKEMLKSRIVEIEEKIRKALN